MSTGVGEIGERERERVSERKRKGDRDRERDTERAREADTHMYIIYEEERGARRAAPRHRSARPLSVFSTRFSLVPPLTPFST